MVRGADVDHKAGWINMGRHYTYLEMSPSSIAVVVASSVTVAPSSRRLYEISLHQTMLHKHGDFVSRKNRKHRTFELNFATLYICSLFCPQTDRRSRRIGVHLVGTPLFRHTLQSVSEYTYWTDEDEYTTTAQKLPRQHVVRHDVLYARNRHFAKTKHP